MEQTEAIRILIGQRAAILGYVRAIIGDPHLAEDVFQDLSALVLRKHDAIPNATAFAGWIRIAARHQAKATARHRGRGGRILDESAEALVDSRWNELPTPDLEVELEALRRCLDRLSPGARDLLDLRYSEGCDGDEIARRTGRKLNTVYVTLSRIQRRLADCVRSRLGMA